VANIVVSALSTFNNKGLKKGKKEIGIFEKQVKSFQRTFLAAFSVTALTRFSKEAVKAFMADEKAAKSLEQQLKNTGYQFSAPGVELYIANLQRATGVLDDELRPAFQQLLTVTGSVTTSQDALNTAMNVSAATGKSLAQVTQALSRAYAGNTTGLSRLGAGLDKTLLKAGDMDAIMAELNNKFAGQAQARLTTYAGKMDLLRVATQSAKEEIGKGLLDALATLGEDNSIENVTRQMEDLGKTTANTIRGIGVLAKGISDIPGLGTLAKVAYETSLIGALSRLGKENAPARVLPANEQRSASRISAQQFRTEVRQKNELNRLRTQEITNAKKKTAVDKLKDQFDIERIGFTKALNEATDKETKLRLEAQIAILDNNEAMAKKLLAELKAAQALTELEEAARKAATAWGTFDPAKFRMGEAKDQGNDVAQLLAALAAMQGLSAAMIPKSLGNRATQAAETLAYGQKYSDIYQGTLGGSVFDPSFARRGESQDLTITVDVAQTGDRFAALIAESLQIAQKSGISYGIAGGL
jgi:hypothetical protein